MNQLPLGAYFKHDINGDFVFEIISKEPLVYLPKNDPANKLNREEYKFTASEEEANLEVFFVEMKYFLIKKETGNKAAKFHYTVVDENGKIISERNSNREYVACTIEGNYYFGRLDLIGKGDHGKYLKYCQGFRRSEKDKFVKTFEPRDPSPIAYLKS